MKDNELIELLKHFRNEFERIARCYLDPNVDEDEYAVDDGKDLIEITEEAIKQLTTLIQGSVLDLNGKLFEVWTIEDKRSNFQKAFDDMTAKIVERETNKGAWNEPRKEPSVADIMGETFQYDFKPSVLPKDERKWEKDKKKND